ncbi:hypothetical protein OF829_17710 [Sphingomonas sp. LB-2]|uniref:surface-adhesin E family protein n=1 Tax=Sphingomonas caeni TaxID=2984949 RepID=UPI00222E0B37|nr:surface-adhesin E family protein [Sphingomonas caeni]MCW3849079.1 hypothetical protein [Sphingomonas caeni]
MLRIASIAFGLLTASAAQAQDWRLVSLGTDPEVAIIIDANIDRSDPARPIAWVPLIYPAGKEFAYVKGQIAFDCARKMTRGLQGKAYDEAGKVLIDAGEQEDWQAPASGSAFELAFDVVCENAPMGESLGTGSALPTAKARETLAKGLAAEARR